MRNLLGFGAICAVLTTAGNAAAVGEAINGFPNWNERVIHAWMNRARCDPKVEMMACGNNCPEGACYNPIAPLVWDEKLNHAARYHSAEMVQQAYFAHDSACTVVNNINTIYPGQCNGAASCGCVNGMKSCQSVCTTWAARIGLFGANASGEIRPQEISSSREASSSWLPCAAFVVGVSSGFGRRSCLRSPSGRGCPQ